MGMRIEMERQWVKQGNILLPLNTGKLTPEKMESRESSNSSKKECTFLLLPRSRDWYVWNELSLPEIW